MRLERRLICNERRLVCNIFFNDTSDLPMFGNGELVKRAELYKQSNNVGTSGYQTFLTDPQPTPAIEIKTPGRYILGSIEKPQIKKDSVNYFNQNNELLGGIVNINPEEIQTLLKKYSSEEGNKE